jgi:hypothetical protein
MGQITVVQVLRNEEQVFRHADVHRIKDTMLGQTQQSLFDRGWRYRCSGRKDLHLVPQSLDACVDCDNSLLEALRRDFLSEVSALSVADRHEGLVAGRLKSLAPLSQFIDGGLRERDSPEHEFEDLNQIKRIDHPCRVGI